MAHQALRGDPLVLDVNLTLAGEEWADMEDYAPRAELRHYESDADAVADFVFDFTGDGPTMGLDSEAMADIQPGTYVTDIEFTDPNEANPLLATFTWPGPGEDRIKIEVTGDVTRTPSGS